MAEDPQKHLYDLIKEFKTAMLVTQHGDRLHARPMPVAELTADGDAYFSTSIDSQKIAEIEADPRVLITFQNSSQFASIEGTATVTRDRSLIDRLWSDAWRVWFPGGRDDPSLCLLEVQPTGGEFWDNSGTRGLKFLFAAMKSLVEGRQPDRDQDQNAKLKL